MSEDVTARLAEGVAELSAGAVPAVARESAQVFLMNALGTVIAGSRRPVVDRIVRTGRRCGARSHYSVPGRTEPLDIHGCALATGAAGHVDDFDDTHPVTYIHAGPTLVATCLALAQRQEISGRRFLDALAVGYEIQFRVGLAVSPEQYLAGWHSTGVFGVVGATAAACVLLDLGEDATADALGFGANLVLGHQEGLGTMNKSFHAGKAAANAIFAACAAQHGMRPGPSQGDAIEELLAGMAIGYAPRPVEADIAETWLLPDNLVKPFPCGIVAHPAVEAAIQASAVVGEDIDGFIDTLERVVVTCSPLAARLTGIAEPSSELNARLSVPHAVAAALITGRAGLRQFDAASVTDPAIGRVRRRVEMVVDHDISEFNAFLRIERTGREPVERGVAPVIGSPRRPMAAEAVAEKFTELVEPVLPGAADRLREVIEGLEHDATPRDLLRLTVPSQLAQAS
ncbi:MmgE/PrpD family protein [Actinacidiphila oryziradicis]|uniref:MmgE/PrpD family protein n=1 Tax=Actinacidiphila oryziradicis TaxID=2571141 RepID=UPI0023F2FC3D|nr:MmgE/PrpD family protein [Actinacidiphila oryziradicis]MCW2868696.1 mmgE/PrpD family protein [Actinacidiphila oryziradicis]